MKVKREDYSKFYFSFFNILSSTVALLHVSPDSIPKANYLEEMITPGGYMLVNAFKHSEDIMVNKWLASNATTWHLVAMIVVVSSQIFFKK